MKRIPVTLTARQRRRLEHIRDHPPATHVAKRAVCLLLSADGASSATIAAATGLCIDSVTDIRKRFAQRGLDALHDRPRRHPPSRITPEYRRLLRHALRHSPLDWGYLHSVWSIPRLNRHLTDLTGIAISDVYLRRLVHDEGFVWRRPKHTLRGRRDERAYRRAQGQLRALKKGLHAPTPTSSCGSSTARASTSTRT